MAAKTPNDAKYVIIPHLLAVCLSEMAKQGFQDRLLLGYKSEYATEHGDELWICIDTDHWIRGGHQAELSQVLQECRSKGYGVAISNPCFEVWLLMHFADVDDSLLLELLGDAGTPSNG